MNESTEDGRGERKKDEEVGDGRQNREGGEDDIR